uniref:Uncharacterized protein n=1 Tax=Pyramimonas obovata TaxID=1411642 RepID=A0A7S0RN39_9CHLO|mmetsp:Transcript_37752/g.82106  ORF Transcript_37752/g.82106 Transcript_37752/m.82106 type:complete len:293 (+) Transcript_37752:76-954(+)|eukprot:CAMPEP_0118923576 /NCGR_PEP_ID=MMETSP1169-20130426/2048_1 /TAXON_ID=36882 /ORGANISM="Pyramimonas obovata, Strain CCMP722" /LENGTH=292 /DNA_ID=CAMNT_0006864589 /DNA_START=70 /DNA_END=948 /DNA_ORIENTATION=+
MASLTFASYCSTPKVHVREPASMSRLQRRTHSSGGALYSSKSRLSDGHLRSCFTRPAFRSMFHRRATLLVPLAQNKEMNAGMAAELVGKMEVTEASKILSVLPPYKVVEIVEGAITFKRWETPALRAAQIFNKMETTRGAEVMRLLSQRTAIDILSRMDSDAAAKIVDQLEFPGGILLSMNADSAVNIVKASEKKKDLFRESEWKEFQELQELIQQRDVDIEGIEWYLMYAEQMSGGRLQLLNDQGRWEPFEESGLRGWLFLLVVVGIPTVLVFISLLDLVKAGQDIEKLIS